MKSRCHKGVVNRKWKFFDFEKCECPTNAYKFSYGFDVKQFVPSLRSANQSAMLLIEYSLESAINDIPRAYRCYMIQLGFVMPEVRWHLEHALTTIVDCDAAIVRSIDSAVGAVLNLVLLV